MSTSERLTAEREAEIRKADESYGHRADLDLQLLAESISCPAIEHRRLLLSELDAVRAESGARLQQCEELAVAWTRVAAELDAVRAEREEWRTIHELLCDDYNQLQYDNDLLTRERNKARTVTDEMVERACATHYGDNWLRWADDPTCHGNVAAIRHSFRRALTAALGGGA